MKVEESGGGSREVKVHGGTQFAVVGECESVVH